MRTRSEVYRLCWFANRKRKWVRLRCLHARSSRQDLYPRDFALVSWDDTSFRCLCWSSEFVNKDEGIIYRYCICSLPSFALSPLPLGTEKKDWQSKARSETEIEGGHKTNGLSKYFIRIVKNLMWPPAFKCCASSRVQMLAASIPPHTFILTEADLIINEIELEHTDHEKQVISHHRNTRIPFP